MFKTHTCLFLDYSGYPDYDTYSATCLPDAERNFHRDHPGRELIFIGVGLKSQAMQQLGKAVWLNAGKVIAYQCVFQEDVTDYILTHEIRTISDEAAIEECNLAYQEAAQARADDGGFGLRLIGLWRVYPYTEIDMGLDRTGTRLDVG